MPIYIKGESEPVTTRPSKQHPKPVRLAPVTTFWHIRKGRSKKATLCGSVIAKVTEARKKADDKMKSHGICTTCINIQEGRDPVFHQDSGNSRMREQRDSRVKPRVGRAVGGRGRSIA